VEQIERTAMNKFSEGRSGSFFYFTENKRYIIKSITKAELSILKKLIPIYYQHSKDNPSPVLSRIVGVHSVRRIEDKKEYLMVMTNAFPPRANLEERYDIKGSWIKRSVGRRKRQQQNVLKMDCGIIFIYFYLLIVLHPRFDTDVEHRSRSKGYTIQSFKARYRFKNKHWILVLFINIILEMLESLNIMDYSLLVGKEQHLNVQHVVN
jgi:hypothetical protein